MLCCVWHLSMEVTFQAVRSYLGVETQRQWLDRANLRTTPALLDLFSRLALATPFQQRRKPVGPRRSAWYTKQYLTFADVQAFLRQSHLFRMSPIPANRPRLAQRPPAKIMEILCYNRGNVQSRAKGTALPERIQGVYGYRPEQL